MGTTPLKLEGTNGDLKEMTTTEENYLAYQAGLHLSVLDSSDVATITTTSSGNTLIGTYTDTTFGGAAGTPSDDSDDFYGWANPGGSGVVTRAAADGTVPSANTHGYKQYASDGVTPAGGFGNRFGVYWGGSNLGLHAGIDSSGYARYQDGLTYFIDADSSGASFKDYTLGNGNILKYFAIRRELTNPITGAVGEHGFSGGTVPVTQTITTLYQREGVTDFTGDSSEYRYPTEFIDNSGTYEIHEFDSSEVDTITDRLVSRIYTSEYPGVYRLAASSPGGNWSLYKSNVFEDRLQTNSSGTAYNLFVKSSITPPTAVRPVSVKRSAGATGTYEGLQEMTDTEIRYTFGARAQSRIMNGTGGVGTYQLRSSTAGAPVDAGTWAAKGTATDTRYDLVNTDYSSEYARTSTQGFLGNYARTSTQGFLGNYARTSTRDFLGNYVRTSTRDFLGNYARTSTRDFLGNYARTSTRDFLGNYARTSTRTSTRTRTSLDNFTGNYARNFTGNYSRFREVNFAGNYARNFAGNYTGDFTRNNFDAFTGDFVGNYARNSTRDSNRESTRDSTTDYVGNFAGNYARNFLRARGVTYTGNFVGNYGRFVLYGTTTYQRTRVTNYIGNFLGNYARNYARTRVNTYTGNFTGNFAGDFTGDFTGDYARDSNRTSITTYVGTSGNRYYDSTNLLASNFPQWTTGTGSATGYGQNGDGNSRISDTSPKGTDIVWDVSNQDAASDADGGWNSSVFNIDRTKTYRFSVWVRRKTIGNGSFYLGVGANTVNNRSNGAQNSNPYFQARGWWDASSAGQWFLVVGHVYSNASGTGGVHPDSGIYNESGEKVISADGGGGADFYWTSSVTQTYHRTYLYYSTNTTTNQQFWEPRVEDISNSNTPTIAQLISQEGNYLRTSTRTRASTYARNFTGNFSRQSTRVRSSNYLRQRDSNYAGNYAGNFVGDYTVNRSSNYVGNYTVNRSSNYVGNYTVNRSSNYVGNYTVNRSSNYLGEYTVNRSSNYVGNYTVNRSSNYVGNYLGNYVGTTISSGTSTIQTYTLYVRTA